MLEALVTGLTANNPGSRDAVKVTASRNDFQKQPSLSWSSSGQREKRTLSSDPLSVSALQASEAMDIATNEA